MTDDNVEQVTFEDKIIENIIYDREYAFKVLPYTKKEYFSENYNIIVQHLIDFFAEYGSTPSKDELHIDINSCRGITDKQLNDINRLIDRFHKDDSDRQWLIERTEKFYRDRSLTNAIIASADILEKGASNTNEILKLVQDALAVNFDSNLGHDYFRDFNAQYESYHKHEDKITTGVPCLDDVTLGGFSRKSLNCFIAPSGHGKSLMLISTACNAIRSGYNALYITLELSELSLVQRFDANMMNVTIPSLYNVSLKQYTNNIDKLKQQNLGRLVVKEFPTSTATVLMFKNLLNELKLKQGFIPDIICVDYINLMASCRYKAGNVNSYAMVKAISEELRGLAVEFNVAIVTATQTNRNGVNNGDFDVTDVSDSFGLVFTLDTMFALIRTEGLDEAGQILLKQLKNRYSDLNRRPTMQLGLDMDHMRIYDLNDDPYRTRPEQFEPQRKVVPQAKQPTEYKLNNNPAKPKNDFSKFNF